MELGLSLGERASKPSFGFLEKARDIENKGSLGFCMGLSVGNPSPRNNYKRKLEQEDEDDNEEEEEDDDEDMDEDDPGKNIKGKRIKKPHVDQSQQQEQQIISSKDSPLIQLDLLPNTPVPRQNQLSLLWPSSHNEVRNYLAKGLDVNRLPAAEVAAEEGTALSCSPPNSAASSFQMDFGMYSKSGNFEAERGSSRASDEDENGSTRKKLRLSKEQSAFLEESFKEHNTLNPKQKLALAKQLNLRPRQVEVWFQNRRARTKLKQTEVDCEYLKRCCETLTEENRRLHKELQELRALKTCNPFYMQLPATTLTMCPSCERVATTSTTASAATTANPTTTNEPASSKATELSLSTKAKLNHPFNQPTIS